MSQALIILCATSDIMSVVSETEDNSSSHSRRGERLVGQYMHDNGKMYNIYSTGVLEKALTMGAVYVSTTRRELAPTDTWWRRLVPEGNVFSTEILTMASLKLLPYWEEWEECHTPDDVLITPALRQAIDEHTAESVLSQVMDDSSFLWKLLFNHLEIDWPQEDYGDGLEDAHWATALQTASKTYPNIVLGFTLQKEIQKSSREKYMEQLKRAR